jgi:hypothetical protein
MGIFLQGVAATADDGSGLASLTQLQSLADTAMARTEALTTIASYAQANAAVSGLPVPTATTFQTAGVTLPTLASLSSSQVAAALNSALLTSGVNGTVADSTAEVQALADAYGRILNDGSPALADYQALGVSLGAVALNTQAFGLYNSAVLAAAPDAVDSIAELNALASVVNRLMLTVQGATPLPALHFQVRTACFTKNGIRAE